MIFRFFPELSDGKGGVGVNTDEFDDAARAKLGRQIDRARSKMRLTLTELADRAGYDERTVRNVIKGKKTRFGTIEDICNVLQISLGLSAQTVDVTDELHGGYTDKQFQDYIGPYFSYRRSFTSIGNLLRSLFVISWNSERKCLTFSEHQRYVSSDNQSLQDYSQHGDIFVSNTIGLFHLVTIAEGAVRLITITKLSADGTMKGIVLTQMDSGFFWQPCVSPILLVKADASLSMNEMQKCVGPLIPADREYERHLKSLAAIEEKVGVICTRAGVAESQLIRATSKTV
jgi:DNA-binding Xre family transcriptional regulator